MSLSDVFVIQKHLEFHEADRIMQNFFADPAPTWGFQGLPSAPRTSFGIFHLKVASAVRHMLGGKMALSLAIQHCPLPLKKLVYIFVLMS